MKRINILESQYMLLNEGMSNILYHFTSINHGYSICKEDKIYLQSAFSKDADNYDNKRKFYLSCTRMRSSQFGYSKKFMNGGVRIVLDGDALATKFKGKQINYWGGGVFTDKFKYYENLPKSKEEFDRRLAYWIERFKKQHPEATPEDIQRFIDYNYNNDAQTHVDNESEDRIFSYDSVINDAHKYIKSIDVLIPGLEGNKGKTSTAAAFLFSTPISRLVKIYDSVEAFNNPKGKDCNDKIEYVYEAFTDDSSRGEIGKAKNCLDGVIQFIAYGNPDFDDKKYGKSVMNLLKQYGLDEFKSYVGQMYNRRNRFWGGVKGVAENLDSVRRDLSDNPNRYTAKIAKMMTDYFLSIGAKSFREAYLIKEKMVKNYYSKLRGGYASERIDTMKKEPVLLSKANWTVVLYPSKELFSYVMDWNDEWIQANSDSMSYDAFYEEGLNHSRSNNPNSLRTYLFKLFKKGTVSEVLDALGKIGFSKEYLAGYNIDFEYKELDYYDAIDYGTANSRHCDDYKKASKIKYEEIENFFAQKQKVSQS